MSIIDLWMPIVLSGVVVFFLSFIMWMVMPHHRSDWPKLPDEDGVMADLRKRGVTGGQYSFPNCSDPKQWKDPDFIKKWEGGPTGLMIIQPTGPKSMGKNMALSFGFDVIICALVAYVAIVGLDATSPDVDVMRLVTTASFLAYAGAHPMESIWFSRSWSSSVKMMFDGLVYAVATGLIFMFLWPTGA